MFNIRSGIPIQLNNQYAVASIQVELNKETFNLFRTELLTYVNTMGVRGIILDLSGLQIIDHPDFLELKKIIDMAKVMGFNSVVSGMRPEVVSSLVALDADIDGIHATLTLDGAFNLMDKFNNLNQFESDEIMTEELEEELEEELDIKDEPDNEIGIEDEIHND